MTVIWNLSLLWFTAGVVLMNPLALRVLASTESSGEYLQKVMSELQEFNSPPGLNSHNTQPTDDQYKHAMYAGNKGESSIDQFNDGTWQNMKNYRDKTVQPYRMPAVRPTDRVDLDQAQSEDQPQYYRHPQVQAPVITKMHEPEALGLTRAQLASMYKTALEKGSAVSLASLTNALAANTVPHVAENHLELPGKQPMYQYYFFPLKTFASELTKTHGYKTIPAAAFENTQATETSQTHVMNPLFVAISTFISMAVIFVMGILFLPKMAQYGVLHSRESQDDILNLPYFVDTVIDQYYSLERSNRTNKHKRKRKRRVRSRSYE